jgi:LysM repeat protein
MDTISRENNNMLPIFGVILGGLGLVLGGVAFVQISKVKQTVAEHDAKVVLVDGIKATAEQAQATANQAIDKNTGLQNAVQKAINEQISPALLTLREDVTKIQEAAKKAVATVATKGGGPVVPGPGEYVIKAKDTFAVIARAHGCTAADIAAVNPGVDSSKLKVGQKIKLPAKAK